MEVWNLGNCVEVLSQKSRDSKSLLIFLRKYIFDTLYVRKTETANVTMRRPSQWHLPSTNKMLNCYSKWKLHHFIECPFQTTQQSFPKCFDFKFSTFLIYPILIVYGVWKIHIKPTKGLQSMEVWYKSCLRYRINVIKQMI